MALNRTDSKVRKVPVTINILVPIVVGFLLYAVVFGDAILVNGVIKGIGITIDPLIKNHNHATLLVRYYLADMLWAYSLTFACYAILRDIVYCIRVAIPFSVLIECLQIVPGVPGVFDLYDILVEMVAVFFAVFVLRKLNGDM